MSSWLSPVSWAKWTWTAVRGGEGEEEEEGEQLGKRNEEEEEEEDRSQEFRQVLWRGGVDVHARMRSQLKLRGHQLLLLMSILL